MSEQTTQDQPTTTDNTLVNTDTTTVVDPAAIDTVNNQPDVIEPVTHDGEADQDKAPTALVDLKVDDFTFPEGVEVDQEALEKFLPIANELKLGKDAAQKFIDLSHTMQTKWQADQLAYWDKQKTDWETQSRSDKEFGGEKFNENLAIAGKAFDAFATPELKQMLADSGYGNHPELIRAFYKMGLQLKEDNIFGGGNPTKADTPYWEKLYDNS